MILVAGGTGTLGTQVVNRLSDRGLPVRVLTRDRARADHLPGTAQTVLGDVRDPAASAAAVSGCTTVVSAVHGFVGPGKPSPQAVDRDGNSVLFRAAAAAGVEHVVLVSVLGAAADHPMSLHRAKYAAEQALIGSGLPWTIVRPSAYLETWVQVIGANLARSGRALVFGPGTNPINFVSAHDVADLVDQAMQDHTLRGRILEVTGPQDLTLTAFAERLVADTGRPGRISHIPLVMLRAMSVLARPASPAFARQAQAAVIMNTTDMTARSTGTGHPPPIPPTTTLDDVLARQRASPGHTF